MLLVQRLKRPNKHSGYKLDPGQTTVVRGLTIVNGNDFAVRVDKYTRKKPKNKKKVK
tara:strand:- start:308 stop:478 length:171 start_codon:yes stop_codon:yes gene_type:complete